MPRDNGHGHRTAAINAGRPSLWPTGIRSGRAGEHVPSAGWLEFFVAGIHKSQPLSASTSRFLPDSSLWSTTWARVDLARY
jgi:hypothetical protein